MSTLLIVLLVLIVLGGVGPWWGYSAGWGHGPVSVVGVILVVLVVLLLTGRL